MSEQPFSPIDNAPQTLNPWRSIWLHPRRTIRHLLNTDPRYAVLLLAIAGGISNSLDIAREMAVADTYPWPGVLGLVLLLGAVLGIAVLYFSAWVTRASGSWIGGRATCVELRTVQAWSNVPILWGLLLWLPMFVFLGQELFSEEILRVEANPALALLTLGFFAVSSILGIWSIVLWVAGVAEVQGFSIFKAIINLVLGFFLTTVIFSLLGVVLALLIPLLRAL